MARNTQLLGSNSLKDQVKGIVKRRATRIDGLLRKGTAIHDQVALPLNAPKPAAEGGDIERRVRGLVQTLDANVVQCGVLDPRGGEGRGGLVHLRRTRVPEPV